MTRKTIEKCVAIAVQLEQEGDIAKATQYLDLATKAESRLYEVCQACPGHNCPGVKCDDLDFVM